jgi:hypothetical protein
MATRRFRAALVGAASTAVLFGFQGVVSASAYASTSPQAGLAAQQLTAAPNDAGVSCTIPNSMVCQVANPEGVRRVVVKQGNLVLVDKTFPCETPVTVSWDSAYHADEFDVETCSLRLRLPLTNK